MATISLTISLPKRGTHTHTHTHTLEFEPLSTCYIANTIRIPIPKCTNLQSNVVIKIKIFSNEELDINFYEELIWIFEISVKNKSLKQVLDKSKFQHY